MLRNHTFCTRFRAFRPARLVSLLLAALLVFSALPAGASGLSAGEGAESGTMAPETVISAEDISRRGDFEKHYLLSDGSFVAVSYAEAVHYRDANGEWAEVDNTLTRNASSGRITNSYGGFGVSFADSAASNAADGTVSISYGGDTLSWTLSADSGTSSAVQAGFSAQIIGAGEASAHAAAGRSVSDAEAFTSAKLSGRVSYTGLLAANPEIAVNYTVFHNKIEEDIILASPTDARVFTLDVKCGTLSARVEEDNSVVFLSEQGEVCFRIGIPYMEDAAGEVLNDIAVSAVRTSGGWAVSYTPDEEWLRSDERVYPILLDPSVTTGEYVSNIADTYVYRGNTADHSSEQRLYVGVKNGNVYRTFLKINNLPSIAANMPITGATLKLTRVSGTSTGKTVKLYRCGQSWSPSGVTYANQPGSLTYIGYSDFSSSTNYYSFSLGSYASSMFTDFAAGNYFGYMLRYGDESTTNPDYNILYSSEYTDSGSRPLLTVTYGYSLPSGLVNGGVYAFRNGGSGSYMTVHNGNDANAVNVYQKKISSTSALGDAQRFKLEYNSSTGGYYLRAMCSSEGTNRVLDIVKSGGYVKSGCNVQIHTAIDPLAQHWFIVAISTYRFKLLPRTAMNLALTAYPSSADGTSGGTTSSSAGNIYVSSFSSTNEYQQWEIVDESGNINPGQGSLENGTYYFNNPLYGKYLGWDGSADNSVKGKSGYISEFGNNIRWKLTNVSGKKYTIQSARDTSQYLTSPGYFPIMSTLPSGGTIPDKFLWEITYSPSGGMLIKNVAYGTYLQTNSAGSLHLDSFSSTDSDRYQYSRWRALSISRYGNGSSYELRELTDFELEEEIYVERWTEYYISIIVTPGNAGLAMPNDFTLSTTDSSVTIDNVKHTISSDTLGDHSFSMTHKVTGKKKNFVFYVGNYTLTFGFSTDNYTAGCRYGHRSSELYANRMYLKSDWYPNDIFYGSNRRMSNNGEFGGASKRNFQRGGMIDDVDFMIYIGHGISATRNRDCEYDASPDDRRKGNFLHFNYTSDGHVHGNSWDDKANLYTSEARFGSPTSRNRWVLLYTCRFLETNEYVSENDLKKMLNGTHILMGYETQAYLCEAFSTRFAERLQKQDENEDVSSIINAFFHAGDFGERPYADDNHIQVAYYVSGTRYETIYDEFVRCSSDPSNIYKITNGIRDNVLYE